MVWQNILFLYTAESRNILINGGLTGNSHCPVIFTCKRWRASLNFVVYAQHLCILYARTFYECTHATLVTNCSFMSWRYQFFLLLTVFTLRKSKHIVFGQNQCSKGYLPFMCVALLFFWSSLICLLYSVFVIFRLCSIVLFTITERILARWLVKSYGLWEYPRSAVFFFFFFLVVVFRKKNKYYCKK